MAQLLEYVGNVHIFLGPYRGNPIALYLLRNGAACQIAPRVYPWNTIVGEGETPNRAAADFEEKWKVKGLSPDLYTGPHWEGGIKPERPAPSKPAGASPAAPPAGEAQPQPTTAKPAAAAGAPVAASSEPAKPSGDAS